MLEAMDTENGGVITLDELKKGLRGCCSVFKQTEINGLMEAVSSYCMNRKVATYGVPFFVFAVGFSNTLDIIEAILVLICRSTSY